MAFSTVIDPKAIQDIQEAIDYYEEKEIGLGKRFENSLNEEIIKLQVNPFYQIRYDSVHCLPMKKYPYMIHYTVEKNELIKIRAVFNTKMNPNTWKERI